MLMATIFVIFLMVGAWALVSGSQQWGARREAQAAAAAAARAAAQAEPDSLRGGTATIDPAAASSRAQAVLGASGYGGSVRVSGLTVTVTVTVGVSYAFPAPGFPGSVNGSATAVATRGVTGDEGG